MIREEKDEGIDDALSQRKDTGGGRAYTVAQLFITSDCTLAVFTTHFCCPPDPNGEFPTEMKSFLGFFVSLSSCTKKMFVRLN